MWHIINQYEAMTGLSNTLEKVKICSKEGYFLNDVSFYHEYITITMTGITINSEKIFRILIY